MTVDLLNYGKGTASITILEKDFVIILQNKNLFMGEKTDGIKVSIESGSDFMAIGIDES